MNNRRKVKRLGVIWLTLWGIAWSATLVFYITQLWTGNAPAISPFSVIYIIVAAYVLLVSTPLLLAIRYHAKCEKMKVIVVLTTIGLLHHLYWLLLSIIAWFS
jgi:uncharacterized membrane protein